MAFGKGKAPPFKPKGKGKKPKKGAVPPYFAKRKKGK